jgi:hypothetical protein
MLLYELTARKFPAQLMEAPEGVYDHSKQQYVYESNGSLVPMYLSGGTGDPTTYSGTTSMGKDNDTDDKGT